MINNQMMEYYVRPWHLYSHSTTRTHSGLCRRSSKLAASHICYLLDHASVHEISALVTWFQYMLDISNYYGDLDPLYIFSHYGDIDPLYIFIMEILIYVYCTWWWPLMWYLVSCLFMAIVLLCIWDCYMYVHSCIIVLCWLGGWSSIWDPSSLHLWDGLIMYFGHRMTPLTSHIRGHLL